MTYQRALELFKTLGATDARYWASEESRNGQASLARFLLLRGLWSNVIDDSDGWMDEWASASDPVPAAIGRMLAKGIDPADLTDVVRDMQVVLLFNVCCLLDDSQTGIEREQKGIAENVEWCIAQFDGERGEVLGDRLIRDIHGDFHDFDPSGRRGEPRKRPTPKAVASGAKNTRVKASPGVPRPKKRKARKPARDRP